VGRPVPGYARAWLRARVGKPEHDETVSRDMSPNRQFGLALTRTRRPELLELWLKGLQMRHS
jgi:hypothetical protein